MVAPIIWLGLVNLGAQALIKVSPTVNAQPNERESFTLVRLSAIINARTSSLSTAISHLLASARFLLLASARFFFSFTYHRLCYGSTKTLAR